jgi:O-antigen ligase
MDAMNSYSRRLPQVVSLSVFLFFAMVLSAPSGYSYGAALLLLISLAFMTKRPALELSREDKTLTVIFLSIFLISLFIFLLHRDPPKTFDQTSRYVLAIPVLFLLLKVPPRLSYLWAGLVAGSISSAGITLWQRHWLHIERATGFVTSAIPYGDIGLLMSVLCAAGLFWVCTHKQYIWLWRIALLLATVAGFYSFVASETRGGWLAVPPVVLLFCFAFARKRSIEWVVGIVLVMLQVLGALFTIPNTVHQARYDTEVKEIHMYRHRQDSDNAVGGRLAAWHTALINIPKKPLLGWSYKDYDAELARLAAEKKIDAYVLDLANTHNNYLEVWLHQGLVGLLALLSLYGYAFWCFCRRLMHPDITVRALAVSGASLLASFFMFGMTQAILGRNNGILFFLVTLCILWACMRHEEGKGISG